MLLLTHITIALASLLYTTYVYFSPSQTKLYVSYGLAGATLASGTYLVIENSAHLVSACISGIIYLSIVSFGIALARKKLARSFSDSTSL